jgi:hypothetical protein
MLPKYLGSENKPSKKSACKQTAKSDYSYIAVCACHLLSCWSPGYFLPMNIEVLFFRNAGGVSADHVAIYPSHAHDVLHWQEPSHHCLPCTQPGPHVNVLLGPASCYWYICQYITYMLLSFLIGSDIYLGIYMISVRIWLHRSVLFCEAYCNPWQQCKVVPRHAGVGDDDMNPRILYLESYDCLLLTGVSIHALRFPRTSNFLLKYLLCILVHYVCFKAEGFSVTVPLEVPEVPGASQYAYSRQLVLYL